MYKLGRNTGVKFYVHSARMMNQLTKQYFDK